MGDGVAGGDGPGLPLHLGAATPRLRGRWASLFKLGSFLCATHMAKPYSGALPPSLPGPPAASRSPAWPPLHPGSAPQTVEPPAPRPWTAAAGAPAGHDPPPPPRRAAAGKEGGQGQLRWHPISGRLGPCQGLSCCDPTTNSGFPGSLTIACCPPPQPPGPAWPPPPAAHPCSSPVQRAPT